MCFFMPVEDGIIGVTGGETCGLKSLPACRRTPTGGSKEKKAEEIKR